MNKYWLMVVLAGLVEIIWVVGLKHAASFGTWSITIIAIIASFYFLLTAMAHLPSSTVYAMFTGIGTVGTVLTEIIVFGEAVHALKLVLLGTLVLGIIGLHRITEEVA
ncbi:DMT family transporter [Metalysinibacillus jejuensis]|uniref:DMT family transporter n=1 Tax=Metalysinibacillus jejuensis TaxID=914327 RepID=UPI000D3BBCF4|nr:SMR family transporter [Metalysinibacillus jejuensis]